MKSMVDRAYYVGEGLENDRMLAKAIEQAEAVRKARKALVEKYGAKTLMVQGKFVYGIVWDEKQEEKWKKLLREQDGMYCYEGNGRYKLGRQLNDDINDPEVTDHSSTWLIKELGVDHAVCFASGLAYTVAGWNRGHILMSIPVGEEPLPAIPEWFREVTTTEWNKWNAVEEEHGEED